MMGRKTLNELLERGKELADSLRSSLDDKQQEGFNLIRYNILNGGLGVGVGPPGTGKTWIFNNAHAEAFDQIDKEEVMIHVAPTNRLVEETATRTIALLMTKGHNADHLAKTIRVYGSRFEPQKLDENVKLVITTGYQPGALLSLSRHKKSVHIMIDEASTTALHEAFIPLSMSLINALHARNNAFIGSFNVIGDPMQAIVESYGTRWKYEQLIVYRMVLSIIPEDERKDVVLNPPKMFEIAEKHASSSDIRYFFLDKTYRMPSPSELIVSLPFYNGKLMAVKKYSEALSNILTDDSRTSSFTNSTKFLFKLKAVRDSIDNALESHIPVVYVRDEGFAFSTKERRRPPELSEYDSFRALLGAEVANYIALRTCVSRVLLVSPYNEIVQQAHLYSRASFRQYLGERAGNVSFGTVHSVLGSEADVVVAVMGKEYIGDEYETMYFQMPELINVQLSRHSRMLIVVGNIERLSKNMNKKGEGYSHVSLISKAIEELKERDLIKIVKVRSPD